VYRDEDRADVVTCRAEFRPGLCECGGLRCGGVLQVSGHTVIRYGGGQFRRSLAFHSDHLPAWFGRIRQPAFYRNHSVNAVAIDPAALRDRCEIQDSAVEGGGKEAMYGERGVH